MATFDYRKFLKENKSTYHASLTEGQFSWMTQDTGEQIGSEKENTITVYMHDDQGNSWKEEAYDGYGEFGGMDYYELLDKMNGGTGDRSEGVRKAFDPTLKGKLLFPALTVRPTLPSNHDFTQEAEHDPNQSWYSPEYEDEDDYDGGSGDWFIDMDTPENYDEDELDEGKAAYEYEKGKKAGEEIEKKKMKVSELKAKIKEMVLAEAEGDEEEVDAEAEATDDVTVDTGSEDIEVTDTETTAEVDPNVKAVQDALTQAQAAAQKLGDDKLTDQIGNTITFFTREHVVDKPGAVSESMFPMLKKLLK